MLITVLITLLGNMNANLRLNTKRDVCVCKNVCKRMDTVNSTVAPKIERVDLGIKIIYTQ
jgi:hypothetical protein